MEKEIIKFLFDIKTSIEAIYFHIKEKNKFSDNFNRHSNTGDLNITAETLKIK